MPNISLTDREEVAAHTLDDMERWMMEATQWAAQFDSKHAVAAELITSATYFIVAGGNVCLHAQSLIELAYDMEKGKEWYKGLDSDPILKSLTERRDRLTHGYIRRDKDFRIVSQITVTLSETLQLNDAVSVERNGEVILSESSSAADIRGPEATIAMDWLNENGETSVSVSDWHHQVLRALKQMTDLLHRDQQVRAILRRQ